MEIQAGAVEIRVGDCRQTLAQMAEGSVHCCVTSPPYFGLRDYGEPGQIGLESSPAVYVDQLVEVFRGVHRVLREDGTLWLNLGDSYAGSGGAGNQFGQLERGLKKYKQTAGPKAMGLKPKDLIGIPWRVALALQADGWFLRQDIIWFKPNPMPESVQDRCTKAHEYVFLFSKSERYHFDQDPIREDVKPWNDGKIKAPKLGDHRLSDPYGLQTEKQYPEIKGANCRSVWTVPTRPFAGAHFATFPPELVERPILAGCPEGGTVLDPFGGSGTTGVVAQRFRRRAVLCELNPEYAKLAASRILTDTWDQASRPADTPGQGFLFETTEA